MQAYGFKTAHGSFYARDADGNTIRYKASKGRGQKGIHDPCMCLFVPPAAFRHIEDHFLGTGHLSNAIRLGSRDKGKTFHPFSDRVTIKDGHTPLVIIVERATNQVLCSGSAKVEPVIGYTPIEKRYNRNGTSSTHVGNVIVKIFHTPEELARAAPPELLAAIRQPARSPIRQPAANPRPVRS